MKKIADYLPRVSHTHWAHGCGKCKYGIAIAPDILAAFPLFEGRAVQAHEELIVFCDCKAGHLYRQCLRKRHNDMGMELKRLVLAHINAAASVPSIRLEPTA